MATDTEIRRVARSTRLAIKGRLAAVPNLTEPQCLVGTRAHRAVAAGALIDFGVDKTPMTGAAQAIRRIRLILMKARKSDMMHEILRHRMRCLGPHIGPDLGMADVAFFG
jgi:hypothetical protein